MRRKISTTIYVDHLQQEALTILREETKVPVAEFIRQAIDAALWKLDETSPARKHRFGPDARSTVPR